MLDKFFNPQAVEQRLYEKTEHLFLMRLFLILCVSFLDSYGTTSDEATDAAASALAVTTAPQTLQEFLEEQYPGHGFDVEPMGSYSFVLVCNPANVKQQTGLIVQHPSKDFNDRRDSYFMHVVCTGKSDSIQWSGSILEYLGLDDKQNVMRIKINQSSLEIVDALPRHDGISHWDKISFGYDGRNFSFAQHLTNYGRLAEYWTIQTSEPEAPQWIKICDCKAPGEFIKDMGFGMHRFSYHGDNLLTIEHYNKDTNSFEPTNVTDLRVSLVDTDAFNISFETSYRIRCIKDYSCGAYHLIFLDESSSSSANEIMPSIKEQHGIIFRKLKEKWGIEGRPYADLELSVDINGHNGAGLYEFGFRFKNSATEGNVKFIDAASEPTIRWSNGYDGVSPILTHPPLQLNHALASGHSIPYYYVPPKDVSNQKTLVLMEGGPTSCYDGDFSHIIYHFTNNGWSIIIPQESLRIGYGWKHYEKGLGEMGRGNLHQLLRIFYDARDKGLVPDIHQLSLYGHSYGGFVAASLALRMDELHSECGLTKELTFQSIIADAAMVDFSELTHDFQRFAGMILPGDQLEDVPSYLKKVMPIHRANMLLCDPLTLVHGRHDVRCSAAHATTFVEGLNAAGQNVPLYWHQGEHSYPEHTSYPVFLRAIMENDTGAANRLASEIGLELHS